MEELIRLLGILVALLVYLLPLLSRLKRGRPSETEQDAPEAQSAHERFPSVSNDPFAEPRDRVGTLRNQRTPGHDDEEWSLPWDPDAERDDDEWWDNEDASDERHPPSTPSAEQIERGSFVSHVRHDSDVGDRSSPFGARASREAQGDAVSARARTMEAAERGDAVSARARTMDRDPRGNAVSARARAMDRDPRGNAVSARARAMEAAERRDAVSARARAMEAAARGSGPAPGHSEWRAGSYAETMAPPVVERDAYGETIVPTHARYVPPNSGSEARAEAVAERARAIEERVNLPQRRLTAFEQRAGLLTERTEAIQRRLDLIEERARTAERSMLRRAHQSASLADAPAPPHSHHAVTPALILNAWLMRTVLVPRRTDLPAAPSRGAPRGRSSAR